MVFPAWVKTWKKWSFDRRFDNKTRLGFLVNNDEIYESFSNGRVAEKESKYGK